MNKTLSILFFCITVLFTQQTTAQKLNDTEAELLNNHFESQRDDFDFKGKQVGFFLKTNPWKKEDFFTDLVKRNEENQTMVNQFIPLTREQKAKSGGYDVFVYSWSKVVISRKQVVAHIDKIVDSDSKH
ncbi:MAG: hypothetical protein N4A46_09670 [Schleiferiaceae bacterium]|jgi:hypothetical protein|nr:hypothetical protein [Schleiferiaceae bacterium]